MTFPVEPHAPHCTCNPRFAGQLRAQVTESGPAVSSLPPVSLSQSTGRQFHGYSTLEYFTTFLFGPQTIDYLSLFPFPMGHGPYLRRICKGSRELADGGNRHKIRLKAAALIAEGELSIDAIAKQLGISESTIDKWKKNEVNRRQGDSCRATDVEG